VLYVTERCVFQLCEDGLALIEIAPGIDLERDVLAQMDFAPLMPAPPRLMDARLFAAEAMGLREQLLEIPLARRLTYDADLNALFINFERLQVRTPEDIEAIRREVARKLDGIGRKVYAIVNYDSFSIVPELVDDYAAMVQGLLETYYWNVTRYTTSGFLRLKLGDALQRRGVAPHIYESSDEALKHLRELEDGGGS
jgi:propionate CoA-transferase